MKLKTHFIPRVLNFVNPKICIYDLDGTIIDSSHRAKYSDEGILDLYWKENLLKKIFFKIPYCHFIGNFATIMRMATLL